MRIGFLGDLLFPPKCVGCGERMSVLDSNPERDNAFCDGCRAEWEREKRTECPTCRVAAVECTCTPDVLDRKHIDCISLVKFGRTQSADRLIYSLKKRKNARNFEFAAGELAKRYLSYADKNGVEASDVIFTHVPRKRASITRFGFDHAEILAKRAAELVGCDYDCLIFRKRDGKDQKRLGFTDRRRNVAKSFELSVKGELSESCVVLVDDVVTTGNTARECIRVLREKGVKKVVLLSIARAPEKKVSKRKRTRTKKSKKD